MATNRQDATIEQRLNDLCSGLKRYVAKFDQEDIFTGPSLYFHRRTIVLRWFDEPNRTRPDGLLG